MIFFYCEEGQIGPAKFIFPQAVFIFFIGSKEEKIIKQKSEWRKTNLLPQRQHRKVN